MGLAPKKKVESQRERCFGKVSDWNKELLVEIRDELTRLVAIYKKR